MNKRSKLKTPGKKADAAPVETAASPADKPGKVAGKLSRKTYDAELKALHVELVKLQQCLFEPLGRFARATGIGRLPT